MVNHEIISLMKRRIDELNDEEFSIIRNYVEQRVLNAHTKQANKTGGEMVRRMISEHERNDYMKI